MATGIPSFLIQRTETAPTGGRAVKVRLLIVAKGAEHAAELLRAVFLQMEISSARGMLQAVDARVKVVFLLLFVVVVSVKRAILPELAIMVFLLCLAIVSRLQLLVHYRKIVILTFIFGVLLGLPSAFNVVTPGEIVVTVWRFDAGYAVGPWTLPDTIGLTDEGLRRITILSLRVMNSLSITFLVFATTPFMEIIRALKMLRVPDVFLLTITLAYKYIFLFTATVHDMHLAKMSRLTGPERDSVTRSWAAGRIAFLFRKSQQRCDEVFRAMTARGMSGDMKLHPLPPWKGKDRLAGGGMILVAALFLWM
jgi:cobalt ECF transporter T component CbiQ